MKNSSKKWSKNASTKLIKPGPADYDCIRNYALCNQKYLDSHQVKIKFTESTFNGDLK